jgi:uncharacterized protein YeaO (DUF488 family)
MAKASAFRIKRVYEPPEASDGLRVLVDRLWPRGLGKDAVHLDGWEKEVAPSPELRKWFGHSPERFAEFSRRYGAELAGKGEALARLRALAAKGPVTLLYAAHDEEHNHARVLAEWLGAPGAKARA